MKKNWNENMKWSGKRGKIRKCRWLGLKFSHLRLGMLKNKTRKNVFFEPPWKYFALKKLLYWNLLISFTWTNKEITTKTPRWLSNMKIILLRDVEHCFYLHLFSIIGCSIFCMFFSFRLSFAERFFLSFLWTKGLGDLSFHCIAM